VPLQIAAAKTSNVVVMYASAYGNTAALAQAISRGVVKSGVAVKTVNLEVTPLDDVVAAVKQSDGFTIGSPTLGGHMPTPVQVRPVTPCLGATTYTLTEFTGL
jgi:flavorubredoxin